MKIISLDTETNGVDLRHRCKPFLVTINDGSGDSVYWEWAVNPTNREPKIPAEDLEDIRQRINDADLVVFHNAKFDIAALDVIGLGWEREWWDKTHDTIISAHLLSSSLERNLTTQTLRWLRVDIQPFEDRVIAACKDARKLVPPNWLIAKEGIPGMPSLKGDKLAKNDMWLPKAWADFKRLPKDHPWRSVTAEYANTDSEVTRTLFDAHQAAIKEQGLEKVYEERRKLIRVIYLMEKEGVTYDEDRLEDMLSRFTEESADLEASCVWLSQGKLDSLPKSGTTKAMKELFFQQWKLPVVKVSKKTSDPSADKDVLNYWMANLPVNSRQLKFIEKLSQKRKMDTAISYMLSYKRFSLLRNGYRVMHPSINPVGTAHLRMSSSNPNEQNISKKKDANIRYCFGPEPGWEWWAIDYSNIELRIPAYEAGEDEMVQLFERPNDPPYFGSVHTLIFDILHPELFAEHGAAVKDVFKSTWYQWTKNGDFAVQYGAVEESGTADRAYHVPGAQRRIKERFSKIAELNEQQISQAREEGRVWTVPDKEVGAYPIDIERDERGRIRPTTPLNYHVSGTAMWAMCRAMVRCQEYLDTLPNGAAIVLQVHDELVFKFPKPRKPGGNLPYVNRLKKLMEQSGDDIGIPLVAEVSYHPNNWAEKQDYKQGA